MTTLDTAPAARSMPLREARVRFSQLIALTEVGDTVTVITRDGDGRPIAVIAPASAVRSQAPPAPPDGEWRERVNAGWARRMQTLREQLTERHRRDRRVLLDALARAWAELDRLARPGTDREVDAIRAAQEHLLERPVA